MGSFLIFVDHASLNNFAHAIKSSFIEAQQRIF